MDWVQALQDLLGLNAAGTVEFITDAAGPIGWLVALHLVFVWGGVSRGLQLSLITATALLTNLWLKLLFAEPRPFWVSSDVNALRTTGGFGMPSGHAQGAMAVWGYLAYLSKPWRIAAIVFVILVLLTGLSRVYLGVHSPAQVLVGWGLGLVLLYAVIKAWPNLSAQVSALSWRQQWLALGGVTVVLFLIDTFVVWLRSGFQVDPTWLSNAQTAADRLGTGEVFAVQADLGIALSSSGGLLWLVPGYAAIGICHQRWSADLSTRLDKAAASITTVLFTLLYLWLGGNLMDQFGGEVLTALLAFAYPVLCLYGAMLTVLRLRYR